MDLVPVTPTCRRAGDDLGKYIEDFYSSDETVKSIANEIKDNSSRKMTNKKATKEAKRVAEEAQKKEKDLVEKSTEVITNTWSLFYHITNDRDGHTRDKFPLFGTTSQIYNFSIPLKEIPNIIK